MFVGANRINYKLRGMKRVRIIVYLALISNFVIGQCSISNNVVSNGDFEFGNTGFTSAYTNSPGDLWSEGTFDVISDPSMSHSNFSACTDAGVGSGSMMVINGSSTPNSNIWCQTVAVEAGADYTFSTEITSVHPASVAILQFSINGSELGTPFIAPNTPCTWNQFCETWSSGVNTSADICIVNKNTAASGNDFALDNVKMGKVLGALPVTLGRFEAFNENADVRIEWVSLVEENHDRYEIERSFDGENWSFIGSSSGTMLNEDSVDYVFYDHLPQEGLNYYRLKMISKIGEVEFSDVRAIEHVFYSEPIVETYPNPATEEIHVRMNERIQDLTLINHLGETIYKKSNPELNQTLSVGSLSSGAYYLNFKDGKGKVHNKLFIKR